MSHGQQPNAVDRVIVDPGDKGMEGKNPGLLYMAVSRATTIGDASNNSSEQRGMLMPWDTYVRIHTYGTYGDQTTDSVPSPDR